MARPLRELLLPWTEYPTELPQPSLDLPRPARLWVPALTLNDLATGEAPTRYGTAPTIETVETYPLGRGRLFHPGGGSNGIVELDFVAEAQVTNDATIIWCGHAFNYSTANGQVAGRGLDGSAWNLILGFTGGNSVTAEVVSASPLAGYSVSVSGITATTGAEQRIALVRRGTTLLVYDWRTRQSSSTAVGTGLRVSTSGFRSGGVKTTRGGGHNSMVYSALYPAALSDADVWALLDQPTLAFEPRRIWVPVGAGGGSDTSLEATATAAVTGTAALSTAIQLAATASASATATAAFTTSVSLAAAATASATATADLTTTPAGLVAAATASVTSTAALTTGIPLAAAATASVAATAALPTGSTLAAAAAASLTASAALSTGIPLAAAGSAAVTGAAALTTTPAGLNAAGSASVIGTAALTTAVQLAGAGSASVTGAADLTTSSSAWAAAAIVQAQASAALTTAIRLNAVATASISSTAALTTGVQFTAAGAISVQGTAALEVAASAMAAAAALQVAATAALATAIQLQASGTASITGVASFGDVHVRSPRVYLVPAESRTYVAPGEFRTFTV